VRVLFFFPENVTIIRAFQMTSIATAANHKTVTSLGSGIHCDAVFAICCRLSIVCLSSVTFVPRIQPVEIFSNVSTSLGTMLIR